MIVRNKDIIISTTRPTRGAIALIEADNILIASTGFCVIRDIFGEVDRKYLFRVLRSKMVLVQLGQRSTGGNYPAITQAELEKVLVPFPEDIDRQQYIADQIELMEEKAKKLFSDASKIYKDARKEVEKIILGDSYES
jgi:restriction endonuclease S subunit